MTLTDEDRKAIETLTDACETAIKAAYQAGTDAGGERAAVYCERKWKDGYRGEVEAGFAPAIRSAVKHGWL